MFWLSRWTYSGEPGAGPAAQALPGATVVRIPAAAHATTAVIRLPIRLPPAVDAYPARKAGRGHARNQDRTARCLVIVPGRSRVPVRPRPQEPARHQRRRHGLVPPD